MWRGWIHRWIHVPSHNPATLLVFRWWQAIFRIWPLCWNPWILAKNCGFCWTPQISNWKTTESPKTTWKLWILSFSAKFGLKLRKISNEKILSPDRGSKGETSIFSLFFFFFFWKLQISVKTADICEYRGFGQIPWISLKTTFISENSTGQHQFMA